MAVATLGREVRQRTNSKGQTYPQWFDEDGKMVGCGCDEAKAVTTPKYNMKPCHHRLQHNTALESITSQDVVQHVEEELRNSCCLCGQVTKAVICWKCLS